MSLTYKEVFMIKIICDSTLSIPKDMIEKYDISIVSLKISLGDVEYVESTPDTYHEFYDMLLSSEEFPKTTQPSVQDFADVYNKVVSEGNEAIVFCIGSVLSGTVNGATTALSLVDGASDKISVIDTQSCSQMGLAIVEEAIKDIENGLSREQVVQNVNENIKKVEICFCPDTLEYLKRGGRLSRLSARIGEILKIKPILSFRENTLTSVRKVIGVSKSIPILVARIPETAKKIYACCAAGSKHFEALLQKIKERFPNRNILEGLICPVVTSHVGPAVGVAWME